MFRELARIEANRQGHTLADLTVLSFLIERRIASLEEVEQRIQLIRSSMGERYEGEDVAARINLLIGILRDVYGPKPRGWTPQVIEGGISSEQNQDQDK